MLRDRRLSSDALSKQARALAFMALALRLPRLLELRIMVARLKS
jgi:hypothetical protein